MTAILTSVYWFYDVGKANMKDMQDSNPWNSFSLKTYEINRVIFLVSYILMAITLLIEHFLILRVLNTYTSENMIGEKKKINKFMWSLLIAFLIGLLYTSGLTYYRKFICSMPLRVVLNISADNVLLFITIFPSLIFHYRMF